MRCLNTGNHKIVQTHFSKEFTSLTCFFSSLFALIPKLHWNWRLGKEKTSKLKVAFNNGLENWSCLCVWDVRIKDDNTQNGLPKSCLHWKYLTYLMLISSKVWPLTADAEYNFQWTMLSIHQSRSCLLTCDCGTKNELNTDWSVGHISP